MLKKSYLFLAIFLSQSCLGATAQEITIPGYNPNPSVTASTPKVTKAAAPTPKLATPGDLADIVKAVDFNGWSSLSQYLWTCTPSSFTLTPANAKNKLQVAFDTFTQKNQIPTLDAAKKTRKKNDATCEL